MSDTGELLDVLEHCLNQACGSVDDTGIEYDSMALSAYAEGLRLLAQHGRVTITHEAGRRVIAEPIPDSERRDDPRWRRTRDSTDDDQWKTTPWRIGRALGRTLYHMVGVEPTKDDVLIGMVDKVAIAEHIVDLHNASLSENLEEES